MAGESVEGRDDPSGQINPKRKERVIDIIVF